MELDRRMPFSIEAEQSVLGSILIDPSCMDKVAAVITRDDFYLTEHKEIFTAMIRMYRKSKNIDVVLLLDELVVSGTYDETGGTEYIRLIADVVPTAANVIDYAKIVKNKAVVRRVLEVGESITQAAYNSDGDAQALIEQAEGLVYGLSETRQEKGFVHIKDALFNVYKDLQETAMNPGKPRGTKTGFGTVDDLIVGMTGGDLILVGARPGMGKTSFAMNTAVSAAVSLGKAVCVFSLEMSSEQLANRMLSGEAQVDGIKMRSGQLGGNDWESVARAAVKLSEADILIDDTPGISVTAMKSKLRRVKNLGMVVVDYLQLMQSEGKRDNRVLEVGEISRGLKLLAKELNVPVICCAQLSRAVEQRTSKRPILSDLRDSGAIEQDADVVMFLYREDYYAEDPTGRCVAEVIVAKNRHGSQGVAKVGWIGAWTKFVNLEGDV
jgi:replicative DNA helicase